MSWIQTWNDFSEHGTERIRKGQEREVSFREGSSVGSEEPLCSGRPGRASVKIELRQSVAWQREPGLAV